MSAQSSRYVITVCKSAETETIDGSKKILVEKGGRRLLCSLSIVVTKLFYSVIRRHKYCSQLQYVEHRTAHLPLQ